MNKLMRYLLLMMVALLSTSVMAGWEYKGFGGWRTYDQWNNPLPDSSGDRGYYKVNLTLDQCKQVCEGDSSCKGIEYVDLGGGNLKCEVHEDTFAYCDTRGGTQVTAGKDGCWVKTASTPVCPTQNWKWISFGVPNYPEIRVNSSNYLVVDANLSNNQTHEVTTHSDCSISLQSRQNSQYVRDGLSPNTGHAMATASHLNDAARYIVHSNPDKTYSFQHQMTQGWMYADGYWVRGNGVMPLLDPMMSHFKVTVHQTK